MKASSLIYSRENFNQKSPMYKRLRRNLKIVWLEKSKISLIIFFFYTSIALSQIKMEYYTTLGPTRNIAYTPNTNDTYVLRQNFDQPKTGVKFGLGTNIIPNDYMRIGTGIFFLNRQSITADSILIYSFDFTSLVYKPSIGGYDQAKAKIYLLNGIANFTSIEVPINIFIKLFSIKNIETQLKIGFWGGYLAKWDMKIESATVFSVPPTDEIIYLYQRSRKGSNNPIVSFDKVTAGAVVGLNFRHKKLGIELEYNYMHNNIVLSGKGGSTDTFGAVIKNRTLSFSAQYYF